MRFEATAMHCFRGSENQKSPLPPFNKGGFGGIFPLSARILVFFLLGACLCLFHSVHFAEDAKEKCLKPKECKQAIEENPADVKPYTALVDWYKEHKRIKKGIKYFEKMLKKNPDRPVAHYALGLLCRAKGDYEGAREHYLKAAEMLEKKFRESVPLEEDENTEQQDEE